MSNIQSSFICSMLLFSCFANGCSSSDSVYKGDTFYLWGDFSHYGHHSPISFDGPPRQTVSNVKRLISIRGGEISSELHPEVDYIVLGSPIPTKNFIDMMYLDRADLYGYENYSLQWQRKWEYGALHNIDVIPATEIFKRSGLDYDPLGGRHR